jgi:bud emergence protein 1
MFHSTKERASKSLRRLTTKSPSKSQQQKQQKCLDLPKKIIKALYDYRAKAPHELSFTKGDFFHVVNRENDQEYFEACNPASNLKGLVPVSYFQVIDRTERNLAVHRPISTSTTSTNTSDVDSGYSDISTQGNTSLFHSYYLLM